MTKAIITVVGKDTVGIIAHVCSYLAENNINIEATDKTEIELYGDPKIEIRKLAGEAKLFKKPASKK